ncbi:MAG: hypothetical protein IJZ12_03635 [Clostridia bacterium]|nr:hypothetical protein [Clostridia bacterium]
MFKYHGNEKTQIDYIVDKKQIKLFDFKIGGEKLSFITLLSRVFFFLISKGRLAIYYVKNQEKGDIMHTSYVIGKCFKFPFMKKEDIDIGPCQTAKAYRGKGIYKNVLNFINNEQSLGSKAAYMIVKTDNIPSIKGIETARFKRVGLVSKSKRLKIYKLIENQE